MLYIHHTSCISPQQTFGIPDPVAVMPAREGKMLASEPDYEGIPPGILRRMGKAVRMGVGAAMPLLGIEGRPSGIILGTGMGGMEDCIKFLNQIIEYEEGQLTPGNFVQSTPNAVASQIGLIIKNTGYNITHVHRGLAFEMAMIDATMMAEANPGTWWLTGAFDEISGYNYNIERLGGWYKSENISNEEIYASGTAGSIAGEGAAMFLVSNKKDGAIARLTAVETVHTRQPEIVAQRWQKFLEKELKGKTPDLIICGDNGDSRMVSFIDAIKNPLTAAVYTLPFKHLCGEYSTSSSFAGWLACYIIQHQHIPQAWFKPPVQKKHYSHIAVFNHYKGRQHAFMLFSAVV